MAYVLLLREEMVDGVGDPGGRWIDMDETVTVESSELRELLEGDINELTYNWPE